MTSTRTSLTLWGATGFTSSFIITEIIRQLPILKQHIPNFAWSIAGRNQSALDRIANMVQSETGDRPQVVVVDLSDRNGLREMCENTKLVLSAVGPYCDLGTPLIEAVLEASKNLKDRNLDPCDYLDLCGEPGWIEKNVLDNDDRAQELGTTILHSAGFDSVPADMGVLHAKRTLLSTFPSSTPTSIEMFFRLGIDPKEKFGIHYATYAAAVNGFSSRKLLSETRKLLYAKLTKPSKPPAISSGLSAGFPKRKSYLGGTITHSPDAPGGPAYLIPFFFADPAIVRLTQALDATRAGNEQTDSPNIIFKAHIVIPNLLVLLIVVLNLSLFGLLANYERGRKLLLSKPGLFSGGLVSHEGPTQAQIAGASFTSSFVTRGHSSSLLKSASKGAGPDVKIVTRCSGPEPGYIATPICFVQAARVMLKDRNKIRKGVVTPAIAFAETSLIEEMKKDGRVTFQRLE